MLNRHDSVGELLVDDVRRQHVVHPDLNALPDGANAESIPLAVSKCAARLFAKSRPLLGRLRPYPALADRVDRSALAAIDLTLVAEHSTFRGAAEAEARIVRFGHPRLGLELEIAEDLAMRDPKIGALRDQTDLSVLDLHLGARIVRLLRPCRPPVERLAIEEIDPGGCLPDDRFFDADFGLEEGLRRKADEHRGVDLTDLNHRRGCLLWTDATRALIGAVHRRTQTRRTFDEQLDRSRGEKDHLEIGVLERTYVFFTSDNGPHSEAGNDPRFFDANGPLSGIKRALYDGGIRVPLIVQWKGKIEPGTTPSLVSGQVDFMATAVDIAGDNLEIPTNGISFLPTLLGDDSEQIEHEYLYWEFYEQGSKQALRMGKWKAVRRPMLTGPIEIYDVTEDPAEENDLAKQRPEMVATFERIFQNARTPSDWQARGNLNSPEQERREFRER